MSSDPSQDPNHNPQNGPDGYDETKRYEDGQYGGQQPGPSGQFGSQQQGQYGSQQSGQFGSQQSGQFGNQQPGQYGQPGQFGNQQPGQYGQPGQFGNQQPGQYGQPGQFGSQQQGQFGQPGQYGAQQQGQFANQQQGQEPPQKSSGILKGCLIAFGVIVVLIIAVMVLVFFFFRSLVTTTMETLETNPIVALEETEEVTQQQDPNEQESLATAQPEHTPAPPANTDQPVEEAPEALPEDMSVMEKTFAIETFKLSILTILTAIDGDVSPEDMELIENISTISEMRAGIEQLKAKHPQAAPPLDDILTNIQDLKD